MSRPDPRQEQKELLAAERGTIYKDAPWRVALIYPSPYSVAMASLGFQRIYALLNGLAQVSAERAFVPHPSSAEPLRTLETGRAAADCHVLALSVATEAELVTAARALALARLPELEKDRRNGDFPLVVAGGPLTYADGSPLAALADIVLAGEAEQSLTELLTLITEGGSRKELLAAAASLPGALVPAVHQGKIGRPEPAAVGQKWLPAASTILTPKSELPSMFLVEPLRGCPRRCGFCVMATGSLRICPEQLVLDAIPEEADRVGLVGSAIGSHPRLKSMVRTLVDRGVKVSLSSLQASRLDSELVELLVRGGAQSLTVAADGASQRLRERINKRVTDEHLLAAAALAKEHNLRSLKVYAMVGLPTEEDEDLAELSALLVRMAKEIKVVAAISPFVPKAGTPLAGAVFLPQKQLTARISKVRRMLKGRVELRFTSVRAAWVEASLAAGGLDAGLAAAQASRHGGGFSALRQALRGFGLGAGFRTRAETF